MFKIKDLREEDLTKLEASCSSFHLSYSKCNKFQKQVNILRDTTLCNNEGELWLLVTCCIRAIRQNNKCSKITLNKNHFTEARKQGFKLNYSRFRKVLDTLEIHGFLTLYVGHYNIHNKEDRLTSIIEFHSNFTDLFDKNVVDRSFKLVQDSELLEVRNSITKEVIQGTRFKNINPLRQEVKAYNELLNDTTITILGETCGVIYKRIFMDNLQSSGRFYSGSFQTIKSKYRPTILFDGEMTKELDVTSVHPSILACLDGIKLPDGHKVYDCYQGLEGDPTELRKLFKQSLLCMLYASSQKAAKSSVFKHFKENKIKYTTVRMVKGLINTIFDRIQKHNPQLDSHLYLEESWKKLQFLDSSICRYVINVFVSQGIPILTYHDSFVVPESQVDLLREVVKQAWVQVLGTEDNLQLEFK